MVILIVVQMAVVLMLGLVSRSRSQPRPPSSIRCWRCCSRPASGWKLLNRGVVSASRTRTMVLGGAAMAMLGLHGCCPLLGLIAWVVALLVLAGAATVVLRDSHLSVHRYVHRLGELTLIILRRDPGEDRVDRGKRFCVDPSSSRVGTGPGAGGSCLVGLLHRPCSDPMNSRPDVGSC